MEEGADVHMATAPKKFVHETNNWVGESDDTQGIPHAPYTRRGLSESFRTDM